MTNVLPMHFMVVLRYTNSHTLHVCMHEPMKTNWLNGIHNNIQELWKIQMTEVPVNRTSESDVSYIHYMYAHIFAVTI